MSNHQKRVTAFKAIARNFQSYYANALDFVGNREDVRLRTAQAIQTEIADALQEIKVSAAQALAAKENDAILKGIVSKSGDRFKSAQHKRELRAMRQFCDELEALGVTADSIINDLSKVPTTN